MSNEFILEQDIKDILNKTTYSTLERMNKIAELIVENYKDEYLIFNDEDEVCDFVAKNWNISDVFSKSEIDEFVDEEYTFVADLNLAERKY